MNSIMSKDKEEYKLEHFITLTEKQVLDSIFSQKLDKKTRDNYYPSELIKTRNGYVLHILRDFYRNKAT